MCEAVKVLCLMIASLQALAVEASTGSMGKGHGAGLFPTRSSALFGFCIVSEVPYGMYSQSQGRCAMTTRIRMGIP